MPLVRIETVFEYEHEHEHEHERVGSLALAGNLYLSVQRAACAFRLQRLFRNCRPVPSSPAQPESLPPAEPHRPGAAEGDASSAGGQSRRVLELPPPPVAAQRGRQPVAVAVDSAPRRSILSPFERMSSFLISMVAHLALMLVLAFSLSVKLPAQGLPGLSAELLEPTSFDFTHGDPIVQIDPVDPSQDSGTAQDGGVLTDVSEVQRQLSGPSPEPQQLAIARGPGEPTPTELLQRSSVLLKGGFDSRTTGRSPGTSPISGGSDASESAVEKGLRWLAAQQRPDGSWNFNLENGRGERFASDPGTEASTTASTGLAMLAFLGAGYTHRDGQYRDLMERALYYLATRARVTADGADLQEGTMYAQGIATMALCETYGMTEDEKFRQLAQQAVDFIVYAQDKRGGGWRYTPGQPGDTTVTGWQFMALKSAQMAGLSIPSPTIFQVDHFLDSVQADGGAAYGYLDGSETRPTTTAIGLLCRMYRGWPREHEALQRGAAKLSEWGPSKTDLYYDFYATQVLAHLGGSPWENWNRELRDHLVRTQSAQGLDSGSWHFSDKYGNKGGRLYSTALAVMILEVYYRFLPLYGEEALDGDF